MKSTSLTILALSLTASAHAFAHDFWIELSSSRVTDGSPLTVTLRSGDSFSGERIPRPEDSLSNFVCVSDIGRTPIPGIPRRNPAGAFRAQGSGTQLVACVSTRREITLTPEQFDQHLKDDGLESLGDLRREQGKSDQPAREAYVKFAKSLLTVGEPAGPLATQPTGHQLEIVPAQDPTTPDFPGELRGTVLFNGEPARDLLVIAYSGGEEPTVRTRTGASGSFALKLTKPGKWMLNTVLMRPAGNDAWESFWASLTFETRPEMQRLVAAPRVD